MNDYNLQFCYRAGKQKYDTRQQITDALHAFMKRNPKEQKRMVYQCGFCGGWHYSTSGMKFKSKPIKQFRGSKKPL